MVGRHGDGLNALRHKTVFYPEKGIAMSREVLESQDAGPRTFARGYLFGIPVRDLGLFATLLIGLASGFLAFFVATFVGIVALLVRDAAGPGGVDFTLAYRRIGLPVGAVVGVFALGYLGMLWARRQLRRG